MLALVHACAVVGLEGRLIEVQVDFNPRAALPSFALVGLPGSAVRESRERVRAAIKNSRLQFPNKAYVVNLSPADLPKDGPAYDLSIAVGVLAATDQVPLHALEKALFVGELSLDGSVRHVKGVMAMVHSAQEMSLETAYVPAADASEAALVRGPEIIPIESLGELVEHLYRTNPIPPYVGMVDDNGSGHVPNDLVDFADIKGQAFLLPKLPAPARIRLCRRSLPVQTTALQH